MTYQKILVALDFSELSQLVYQQAIDLAQLYQAKLMLFHAVTENLAENLLLIPVELSMYPTLVDSTYQIQQEQKEKHWEIVKNQLQHYTDQANQQGLIAEYRYQHDQPGHAICKLAQEWDADLIILGRRGFSGIAEVVLGSVSNYVLHHASCSVLVIHKNQTPEKAAEVDLGLEKF